MRGVTLATLQSLQPGATLDDLKALTDAQARQIYLAWYIHGPRIDQLPPEIIPQCSDISVNSGQKRAGLLLQEALNACGQSVAVDGQIGPGTIAAACLVVSSRGAAFNNDLADVRAQFYQHIVAADETQQKFLKGWLIRCSSFRV